MRNFLGTALPLVLGFLGAIVPIWLPGGFFAKSDGGMGRATDLTFLALTDSNAVEVDGLRFETVVPEPVLNIPENRAGATIPVRIGLKITNNTSTPIRFSRYNRVLIQLLRGDGQVIRGGQSFGGIPPIYESDFPLARPGDSVTLFLDGKLFWDNNYLRLRFPDKYASWDFFCVLKPGTYQVRFTYYGEQTQREYYDSETGKRSSVQGFWRGEVVTPFVQFRLVQP